jgi:Cytochrome C oxidase, cbb3-type, subunit III
MNLPGLAYRRHGRSCRRHWSLLALLAGWAAGCDLPGAPKAGDRYVSPQSERSFNVLFAQNCVGCHGADGKLGPAPPLNDSLFLAVIPQTELQRVISEGRPGTLMPAFDKASGGPVGGGQGALGAGRAGASERSASVRALQGPAGEWWGRKRGTGPEGIRASLRVLPRRRR